MFGWFDPVKRLQRRYVRQREAAERCLARDADRAKYADLIAEAEATLAELERLEAERNAS